MAKRLSRIVLAVAVLGCAGILAPDRLLAETEGPDSSRPITAPAERKISERYLDERDDPTDEVMLAEMRRRFPEIDPAEKHNVRAIQNPTDPAEQHKYTLNMARVIDLWLLSGNGSSLAKLFDEQSEEKDRQAVFLALQGYFFLNYPPGDTTISIAPAERSLAAAVTLAPEYAAANSWMAYFCVKYFGDRRITEAERHIEAALKAQPEYVEAKLRRCRILALRRRGADLRDYALEVAGTPGLTAEDVEVALSFYDSAESNAATARENYNRLMASAGDPVIRGVIQMFLGEILVRQAKYEDARSLAQEALSKFEVSKNPAVALSIRVRIIANGYGAQSAELKRSGNSEGAEKADAEMEKVLLECLEIDLVHLSSYDSGKGTAVFLLDQFYSFHNRSKDALAILKRYDKEAKRLTREIREEVRKRIEDVEAVTGVRWPVPRLRELADSPEAVAHLELEGFLKSFADLHTAQPQNYRFDGDDIFRLLTDCVSHGHRGVARRAAPLAAIAANQKNTDEAKELVLGRIAERLGREKEVPTGDVRYLLEDGFDAMMRVDAKAGAIRVADWVAGLESWTGHRGIATWAGRELADAIKIAGLAEDLEMNQKARGVRNQEDAKAFAIALKAKLVPADEEKPE